MIRLAKLSDLNGIMCDINDAKALFKSEGSDQWQDLDNYPNENTIVNDINNGEMYINEINGIIAGCVVLSSKQEEAYDKIYDGTWQNYGPYLVIHRIAIKKEMYRMGIAKELLAKMIEISKEKEISSIKVDTKVDNIRMISLLESFGFKIRGKIDLLRKDCLDKVRIALELTL